MRNGANTGGRAVDELAESVVVKLGEVLAEDDTGSLGLRLAEDERIGGPLVVRTIGPLVLGFGAVDEVRIGDIDCPLLVVLGTFGTEAEVLVLELVIFPKTTVDAQKQPLS